jgi:hypothetical protein
LGLLLLLASTACNHEGNNGSSSSSSTGGSGGRSDLIGTYACTSAEQTQVCDGGSGSGTFNITEVVCPITIQQGTSASALVTVHKDGLTTNWTESGSTEATVDGVQSYPSFANPIGGGTITQFTITGGTMTTDGGTLSISEQGTQVLESEGSWACTFTRSYSGPAP